MATSPPHHHHCYRRSCLPHHPYVTSFLKRKRPWIDRASQPVLAAWFHTNTLETWGPVLTRAVVRNHPGCVAQLLAWGAGGTGTDRPEATAALREALVRQRWTMALRMVQEDVPIPVEAALMETPGHAAAQTLLPILGHRLGRQLFEFEFQFQCHADTDVDARWERDRVHPDGTKRWSPLEWALTFGIPTWSTSIPWLLQLGCDPARMSRRWWKVVVWHVRKKKGWDHLGPASRRAWSRTVAMLVEVGAPARGDTCDDDDSDDDTESWGSSASSLWTWIETQSDFDSNRVRVQWDARLGGAVGRRRALFGAGNVAVLCVGAWCMVPPSTRCSMEHGRDGSQDHSRCVVYSRLGGCDLEFCVNGSLGSHTDRVRSNIPIIMNGLPLYSIVLDQHKTFYIPPA